MLLKNNNIDVSLKRLVIKKLLTPSVLSVLLIILFGLLTFKYWIYWDKNQFQYDIDQYYSYLVAHFIHHDLAFDFPNQYWLVETPIGKVVPKATIGIALLNAPFFILADNLAYAFDYEGNGYSAPYAWCIHFGAIFYVYCGLLYMRKTLLLFFNEWITSLTLLSMFFATNLFYYTFRYSEMPHSYLFFLLSVFVYHVIKWHHVNNIKHLYYFCFVGGFIALIRPTEALVLVLPLLYQVTSLKSLKEKFTLIFNLKWKLFIAIIIFLLPIIPQLIYWKVQTGQFFFFSYGNNEGFFFGDPKLYDVLFGWRKGWFIYTPIMLLSLLGLFIMFKKWKGMFIPIFCYMIINIYLISSWWDWGFGGAFGMRALVQSYAFLALPFAFLFNYLFKLPIRVWLKTIVLSVAFSLTLSFGYLNIYQTVLFRNFYMHWDSMTKEAYFYTLFENNIDRNKLETLFVHPNYEEMKKGNRDE